VIIKALRAPINAIILNSGEKPDEIIPKLEKEAKDKKWWGFNALTNEFCDLKEKGIIDPLKVTKTAFVNAVSVASNYLTIGAAITDIPKKEEHSHAPGMPEEY
jgi:chaperonin GroEL